MPATMASITLVMRLEIGFSDRFVFKEIFISVAKLIIFRKK